MYINYIIKVNCLSKMYLNKRNRFFCQNAFLSCDKRAEKSDKRAIIALSNRGVCGYLLLHYYQILAKIGQESYLRIHEMKNCKLITNTHTNTNETENLAKRGH